MTSFEFATANTIIFGAGKVKGLADQLAGRAKRLLLVRGRSSRAISLVREILSGQDIPHLEFEVHGEPTVEVVREGVKLAEGCDVVVGLGGGSVLDAGKAIAALATNPGDVLDYLEVVGRGQTLANTPLTRLPDGFVGAPYYGVIQLSYNYQPLTADFRVISGGLPPGILMTQNGALTGYPTFAGTFGFVVQVNACWSDPYYYGSADCQTATQSFSITVCP